MTVDRDLIGDRPLPDQHTFTRGDARAASLPFVADAELIAAFAVTLARYGGRPDVVFGWSAGGPWVELRMRVDFDRPVAAAVPDAAEALAAAPSIGAAPPPYGIGRTGAPTENEPYLLAVFADGGLRYAVDRYAATDAQRFAGHVGRVVAALPSSEPAGRVAFLSDTELAAMYPGNARGPLPDDPATLPALIAEQVAARPAQLAVRARDGDLSYAQLWSRSAAVARQLEPGTLVGVWADRTAECLVALVGVLRAGAAYVALEPRYPAARLRAVIEAAGLTTVVGSAAPDELGLTIVPALEDGPPDFAAPAAPHDLAYVMFTSGSTGVPKGVMIEHRSVVNLLRHMAIQPGLRAGEVMLGVTTPAFDLSVPDLFLPLITGARVALADPDATTDGVRLAAEIGRLRPDLMQATPATWRLLLAAGWPGAPGMRIVCGGEAFDAHLVRALDARVAGVWNCYGPTETTVWSTCTRLDATMTDPLPIGAPIRGTACYVLDERGEPAPPGVRGELHIAGAGVARGYFERPDLTSAAFVPCTAPDSPSALMYRTGDLVRVSPSGELTYAGRRDLQVKINGFRVELGEVEAGIGGLPGVREAVAVTRSRDGVTQLICYVTGTGLEAEAVRAAAAPLLVPQARPAVVVVLDQMPLTANGKVDRTALPAPSYRTGAPVDGPFEQLVADVWAEVLGLPQVFADDDVFALGAYSLDIGRIAIRLSHELALDVTPGTIFRHSSVRDLAAALVTMVVATENDLLADLETTDAAMAPDD